MAKVSPSGCYKITHAAKLPGRCDAGDGLRVGLSEGATQPVRLRGPGDRFRGFTLQRRLRKQTQKTTGGAGMPPA
jgi:hypothetical protein